ncbi:MAG: adenylyltransferase [Gemmatales bacterium]|nr:MAG: adenylyltransferase [Gemmatales bacterium]
MPSEMPLTEEERATYEWQMWVSDFGEQGQRKLKNASVLVSRCGGVGGTVAYYLAAAGIGRLILAHAGNVKHSDLNRQLLMTHAGLGQSRIESAKRRLKELNPRLEVVAVAENITPANAPRLVAQADLIVDCAPLFDERFAMNEQAVKQKKPMVDCAMFELEAQLTTLVPGKTPCLRCIYPQNPPAWKRQFPVFGAVSGAVACLAAMEAIKLLAEFGKPLLNEMLLANLRDMTFRRVKLAKKPDCPVCGKR